MKKILLTFITSIFIIFNNVQAVTNKQGQTKNFELEYEFTFQPLTPCKIPKKNPPLEFFDKKYNIRGLEEGYTPDWLIFDINGDGICDWVREAVEWTIYDQEVMTRKNSIILGTLTGWKKWKPVNYKDQFDSPIGVIVYRKNVRRPIIINYSTINERNPSIDLSSFEAFQWNDEIQDLSSIDDELFKRVIDFLKNELCRANTNFSNIMGNPERIANFRARRIPGGMGLCDPIK